MGLWESTACSIALLLLLEIIVIFVTATEDKRTALIGFSVVVIAEMRLEARADPYGLITQLFRHAL